MATRPIDDMSTFGRVASQSNARHAAADQAIITARDQARPANTAALTCMNASRVHSFKPVHCLGGGLSVGGELNHDEGSETSSASALLIAAERPPSAVDN